jgi:hypothetical protein
VNLVRSMSPRAQSSPTSPFALQRALAENWWLLLLRGIAAIAFGVLVFIWPNLTLLTLTFLWGIYAIADGIFALGAAVSGKGGQIAPRWWLGLIGIAGILAGLLTFVWPGITAQVLLVFIASWAIVAGVLGNRSRMDASVERPAFSCARCCSNCPARCRCAGGGLADRFVRDPGRLHLYLARALAE